MPGSWPSRGACIAFPLLLPDCTVMQGSRWQILGSRDEARGNEAVESLRKEGYDPKLVVCDITSDACVLTAPLDFPVAQRPSCCDVYSGLKSLKDEIDASNGGVLDIVSAARVPVFHRCSLP